MNKKVRKVLFIMHLVILYGICIAFAYSYVAGEIDFSPTDTNWNVSKVDRALNDLRENCIYLEFGTPVYSRSLGHSIPTLSKGRYIVVANKLVGNQWVDGSSTSSDSLPITCETCRKTLISTEYNVAQATDKTTSYSWNAGHSIVSVYLVEITDSTDTITATISRGDGSTNRGVADGVALQAFTIG